MQPLDILWGCDLRDKNQRGQALKLQRLHRPRLVAIQFPWTDWSQISRLNYRTPEAKRRLEELLTRDLVFFKLAAQIANRNREWGLPCHRESRVQSCQKGGTDRVSA